MDVIEDLKKMIKDKKKTMNKDSYKYLSETIEKQAIESLSHEECAGLLKMIMLESIITHGVLMDFINGKHDNDLKLYGIPKEE